MKLQYAGFDFLEPTPQVSDVLDRHRDRTAPPLFSYPGWGSQGLAHLPIPPKPKSRPLRYNVLEWPVGASRWSTFRGLVGSTSLAGILTATAGTTEPVPAAFTITDDDDAETVLFTTDLHCIDVRPLYTGTTGRELWDITLVCPRYFWWKALADYTPTDVSTTWEDLIDALVFQASGLVPSISTVPAAYGSPWESRWWVPGCPLPLLIDAACSQVGLRCIYRPAGTVRALDYAAVKTLDDTRWTEHSGSVVQGGRLTDGADVAGNTPENYAVAFPGDKQVITTGTLASLSLAEYTGVVGVPDTYAWIRADLNADTAGAARTAYASQAAEDYYLWALSPTDATFRGIATFSSNAQIVSGLEDRVEIEYLPERFTTVGRPAFGCAPEHSPIPPAYHLASDRVLTRVVPTDRSDRNIWGDRPPPGYSYAVKLKGTADGSGNWKADILVTSGSGLAAGPQLGYGGNEYVLEVSPDLPTPAADDIGVAVPDPFQAYRWAFLPSVNTADATNCVAGLVGLVESDCITFVVASGFGACGNITGGTVYGSSTDGVQWISISTVDFPPGPGTLIYSWPPGQLVPDLSIVIGGSYSGTTYEGKAGGCTSLGYVWFFNHPDLCTDPADSPCGQNYFAVYVECAGCPDEPCPGSEDAPDSVCLTIISEDGACPCIEGTYQLVGEFAGSVLVGYFGQFIQEPCGDDPMTVPLEIFQWQLTCVGDGTWDLSLLLWGSGGPPALIGSESQYWDGTSPLNFVFSGFTGSSLGDDCPAGYELLAIVSEATGSCPEILTCLDGTGEPLEGHPDIEVVIPDGVNAGTYTFVWDSGLGYYVDAPSYSLICTAGSWLLRLGYDEVAETVIDSPFGLVFDGTIYGSTGDVTAEVA